MGYHPSKSINARTLIYILSLPIILLYTLILARCISKSPSISNIFLAELADIAEGNSQLRIGYFTLCTTGNSSQVASCFSTVGASSTTLASTLQAPAALIQYGLGLQQVGFPGFLATSGVLFTSGVIVLLMLKVTLRGQSDPFISPDKAQRLPRRKARLVGTTQGFLWLSTAIAFAVAYETTLVLSSLEFIDSSNQHTVSFQIIRGTGLEVMQWLVFSFSFLFSFGVWRIIRQADLGSSPAPLGGASMPGGPMPGALMPGGPMPGGPPLAMGQL